MITLFLLVLKCPREIFALNFTYKGTKKIMNHFMCMRLFKEMSLTVIHVR